MKYFILLFFILSLIYAEQGTECDLCKFAVSMGQAQLEKNKPKLIQFVNSTCLQYEPIKFCYEVCKIADELIILATNLPPEKICTFVCTQI